MRSLARLLVATLIAFASVAAFADQSVRGYYRSNGTYVQPHYRSSPNSTRNDNYSTRGNTNPYTSQPGYKPRDEDSYRSPSYNNSGYGSYRRGY